MRRLQILRGQLQYKPELKDGEFFLDKTNHSLLIGDAAVADGQFELAKQSAITNLQQQVDTKITNPSTKSNGQVLTYESSSDSWVAKNGVDDNTVLLKSVNERFTLPSTQNWTSVAYGNGKFVAVAESTDNAIYSTDGINWETTTLPSSLSWYSVVYGGDKFVAVAANVTQAAYSTDGITWTKIVLPGVADSIAYGNGRFVGVRFSPNIKTAIYSTDGISWKTSTLPKALPSTERIKFCNDRFVIVMYSTTDLLYSTDGITWNTKTLSDTTNRWVDVAYGDDKFVVVSKSNSAYYSTDFITWESVTLPHNDYTALVYGNNKFVAVRYSNYFDYSEDGITWNSTRLPYTKNWYRIAYGNNKFVTIGRGSDYIMYSIDGIDWIAENASYTLNNPSGTEITENVYDAIAPYIPEVTIPVTSVNTKTGAVVLTAADVGALPDTTSIPTKTSELDNDSGFITAAQAPVQSVDGATGAVTTNAVKYTTQTLTDDQKTQARTNIGAGTSSFSGSYDDLSNKPTIPTKVTDLTDAADYATVTSVNAVADDVEMLNSEVGTLTTDVNTLKTNITSKQNTITGGASTITDDNLTANRALVSNSSGKVAVSDITATELGYLDGVTSNIQTQIDGLDDSVLLKDLGSTFSVPTSSTWKSVAYGDGKIVLSATTETACSSNGIDWDMGALPSPTAANDYYRVAYGNGKFVAITYGSNCYYSTDGVNWTAATMPVSAVWSVISYGNNKFVALSSNVNNAAYSEDGMTWTAGTIFSSPTASWSAIAYDNDSKRFVTISANGKYRAISDDGVNWSQNTVSYSGSGWNSLAYGRNKTFVGVAYNSSSCGDSFGGVGWTVKNSMPELNNWNSIAYGNGKFVAVAYRKPYLNYSAIAYSEDEEGDTWTKTNLPDKDAGYEFVIYTGEKFIAIGPGALAVSTDGITWSNKSTSNILTSTTGTDITSSVYSALEPYIPTPTVPTKTSELTNDSGYITQTDGIVQDGLVGMSLTGGFGIGAQSTPATDDIALFVNGNILIEDSNEGTTYIQMNNGKLELDSLATPTSSDMATPKSYVDQYAPHATLVTLTVAGWNSTSKTQTVTVSGILADESKQLIIPMPATASMTAYSEAGIQCTGQAANSLTFTAETVPTTAISVYVTYQAVIS